MSFPRVGSATVVIELEPDEVGTLLRLTDSVVAPPTISEHHRAGWERYLEPLKVRAEGGDPAPDVAEPEPSRTERR
jgi:activator of Hsp90 ATPase-like protein